MLKRIVKEVVPFVIIIIVVLLIKQFIVTPIQVNGDSMDPTLKNGDLMLLNRLSYKFGSVNRFDIVVVDKGDSYIIKRVIGLPGENIRYEDNKLYVNDELIEEPFLEIGKNTDDFEAFLPDDCYFLMGDNRQVSLDSRALGCFDISKIRGKTSFSFFPFNRFGFKS